MNDFNEAELLAEHQAQKAAAEAAEKIKRDEENAIAQAQRANEQAVRRAARVAKIHPHLERIAAKARTIGHTATAVEDKLTIDGVSTEYYVDFCEMRKNISRWRSEATGKMRFVVGNYGDRTSFPERKDGTFNYEGMAHKLCQFADAKNAAMRMQARQQTNTEISKALAAELIPGQQYQDVITASADLDRPVRFSLKIVQDMTADEARKLAAAIRSAGVKLHYSDGQPRRVEPFKDAGDLA